MRSVYTKLLVLSLCSVGWLGCSQEMTAKRTSLSPEEVEATYGELPETSGEEIVSFASLTTTAGQRVYGTTRTSCNLQIGQKQYELKQGEELFLVAEVKTSLGKIKYIAQKLQGNKILEGYVNSAEVEIKIAAVEDELPPMEGQPPIVDPPAPPVEEETPAPAPAPSAPECPEVSVTMNVGGRHVHDENMGGRIEASIPGELFRRADDDMYALSLKTQKGMQAVKIKVSNRSTGDNLPEAVVALDTNETNHIVQFSEFLTRNNWRSDRVNFNFTLQADGQAMAEEETDCNAGARLMSPIVFDFTDATSLQTKSLAESDVRFDLDADGVSEASGWIEEGTALLSLDLNQNGQIDNGRELFGDASKVITAVGAANGYEALSQYLIFNLQENFTKIDETNLIFSQLSLWFDHNTDGVSQFNELYSLKDVGVESIDTAYTEVHQIETNDGLFQNDVRYVSRFYGPACPAGGCHSYDVYFSTINAHLEQALNSK